MREHARLWVALDDMDHLSMYELCDRLSVVLGVKGCKWNDALASETGFDIAMQCTDGNGLERFIDLKAHDVPRTVANWMKRIVRIKPTYVTVHASGGPKMCQSAVDEIGEDVALGITVLTSLDERLCEAVYGGITEVVVPNLAKLGVLGGITQFVCSAKEAKLLKSAKYTDVGKPEGWAPKLVCPGITPLWAAKPEDQARVMTPAQAIENGADELVVGSAITKADDPVAAAKRIIDEIDEAVAALA